MLCLSAGISGCQSNADEYAADVYEANQLNSKQETKTVNIISVLPAKVAVDNTANKQAAQTFGAILGAVAGGGLDITLEPEVTWEPQQELWVGEQLEQPRVHL